MKRLNIAYVLILVLMVGIDGCKSYKQEDDDLPDNAYRGTINISADESFRPVIDAQVAVYESNHPGATIKVQYKPEAECLKDFAVDSIRMVITTRPYTKSERSFIIDSMKVEPQYMIIARDAVAVIVNPLSRDSVFDMTEIRQILTGKYKETLIPVFDGVKATSTVRFIVDSVLRNDSLTPGAVAARSSEAVIDYVARTPNAVGFIGVSWIGNKDDSVQTSFLKKVKLIHLESADEPGKYVLPVQENIYEQHYPMVRDLVYVVKEKHRGLGYRFAEFLRSDIGQLIFKRAYLAPTRNNFFAKTSGTKAMNKVVIFTILKK